MEIRDSFKNVGYHNFLQKGNEIQFKLTPEIVDFLSEGHVMTFSKDNKMYFMPYVFEQIGDIFKIKLPRELKGSEQDWIIGVLNSLNQGVEHRLDAQYFK